MTWPSWIELVLLALGAWRLTRLVAVDDLTIPLRRRLTGLGDDQHSQFAYVVDHCESVGESPWELWQDAEYEAKRAITVRTTAYDVMVKYLREAVASSTGSEDVPPLVLLDPEPPVSQRRFYLSRLLRCSHCCGYWVSLMVALGWGVASGHVVEGYLLSWPLAGAVSLLSKVDA